MRVRIPKDIMKYKQKFFMGLTLRQIITFALAGGIGTPIFFFTYKAIGTTAAGWIVFLIILPIVFLGIIPFNGMMAEQYLLMMLRQRGRRNTRFYKCEMRDEYVQKK